MADLVNLRTYYVYRGANGRDVTDYWERMTAVRLRYLADPGPAATALRVSGIPAAQNLIGVDGIAALGKDRQRIMPKHAWDWSIPVPLSQGWRVGDKIYVGGQISADRSGKAIAVDDVAGQTANVLDYIRHVLLDGGHDWSEVAALRVCYKSAGDDEAARALLTSITDLIRRTIPAPRPSLSAFGVDLLYEGLLLEIDAVARIGSQPVAAVFDKGEKGPVPGFPAACVAGNEFHIGGLSASPGDTFQMQVEATFGKLLAILRDAGFKPAELVKLTLFVLPSVDLDRAAQDYQTMLDHIRTCLPGERPVLTVLAVQGLPLAGQKFQLDGVAVRSSARTSFF
jgi:enamine deaminase RidA (YjgF/YER057c/UK114 family)